MTVLVLMILMHITCTGLDECTWLNDGDISLSSYWILSHGGVQDYDDEFNGLMIISAMRIQLRYLDSTSCHGEINHWMRSINHCMKSINHWMRSITGW